MLNLLKLPRRVLGFLVRRLKGATVYKGPAVKLVYPPGHFYSPVVDPAALRARADSLWKANPEFPGIDFNENGHLWLLKEVFPSLAGDFDYPDDLPDNATLSRYYSNNSQFGWLDARALFVALRYLRPARIVEVGGGYSTLLTADVNNRFLENKAQFTCIEPYPRPFLTRHLPGLNKLLIEKVEEVPLAVFTDLQRSDVLFIDSSHVAKTGSDVNYLILDVLPRLASGVIVHIHDIFLPFEYPREWVLDENRSWNEQYLVAALLMHSTAFRVLFSSTFAWFKYPELVEKALRVEPGMGYGGCSLWIERL